jgi:dihydrofolate reductase
MALTVEATQALLLLLLRCTQAFTLKNFDMRKIIAGFAASLDGYIEGPNGEYDWILMDKEMNFEEQMKRYDAFFIGRRTYEKMISMPGPPMPAVKNYVFSQTLQETDSKFILVNGDLKQEVDKIRKQPGKDIAVWGGASLLASLLDLDLVDEISVAIIPVLLGKGKPMVDVLKKHVALRLRETKTYGNGTIQATYEV